MSEKVPPKNMLRPRQFRAIAALLASGKVADAAVAAGVTTRTVRRWHKEPDFRHELALARSEVIESGARRLSGLTEKAIDVLEEIMEDKTAADHPRIRAAATVLEHAWRWNEGKAPQESETIVIRVNDPEGWGEGEYREDPAAEVENF